MSVQFVQSMIAIAIAASPVAVSLAVLRRAHAMRRWTPRAPLAHAGPLFLRYTQRAVEAMRVAGINKELVETTVAHPTAWSVAPGELRWVQREIGRRTLRVTLFYPVRGVPQAVVLGADWRQHADGESPPTCSHGWRVLRGQVRRRDGGPSWPEGTNQ